MMLCSGSSRFSVSCIARHVVIALSRKTRTKESKPQPTTPTPKPKLQPGKFQDQIKPLVAPQLKKAEEEIRKVFAKIPRHCPVSGADAASPTKKGSAAEPEKKAEEKKMD